MGNTLGGGGKQKHVCFLWISIEMLKQIHSFAEMPKSLIEFARAFNCVYILGLLKYVVKNQWCLCAFVDGMNGAGKVGVLHYTCSLWPLTSCNEKMRCVSIQTCPIALEQDHRLRLMIQPWINPLGSKFFFSILHNVLRHLHLINTHIYILQISAIYLLKHHFL